MVHELIGIEDNKVDLKSIGKFPKDQEVGYIFYTYYVSMLKSEVFPLSKKQLFCYSIFIVTGGCAVIRTRFLFQG